MERGRKNQHTTKEIRGAIIALHQDGKAYKQIEEQLSIDK